MHFPIPAHEIPTQLLSTPPRRAWTCNVARGDSNTLRVRRAPLNSGFSRKSREKRLEFRAGLYSNPTHQMYCCSGLWKGL